EVPAASLVEGAELIRLRQLLDAELGASFANAAEQQIEQRFDRVLPASAWSKTVVALLIDNSGSMRGRPIMVAACCADLLARTLERSGGKTEVLGFTTVAWKGGRSRSDWMAAGRPGTPGRLSDLRHNSPAP